MWLGRTWCVLAHSTLQGNAFERDLEDQAKRHDSLGAGGCARRPGECNQDRAVANLCFSLRLNLFVSSDFELGARQGRAGLGGLPGCAVGSRIWLAVGLKLTVFRGSSAQRCNFYLFHS